MNLLPLETFREQIGWNPYHFWGMSETQLAPVTSACNTVMREHSWQDIYAVGRAEIRSAIERSEKKIMDYLGYPVAPMYVEETIDWPTYFDNNAWRRLPIGGDVKRVAVRTTFGKILAVGVEKFTDINEENVVFSDDDNDGLDETFTAIAATTETNPAKIYVQFIEADRPYWSKDRKRWRISPVKVSISGGLVTVVGKSWMLIKPILYEGMKANKDINPTVSSNFVAKILISSRSIDPEGETVDDSQATLLWNTDIFSVSKDPAAIGKLVARAGIHNAETGFVVPAAATKANGIWTENFCNFYREPDQVTVRYSAGVPLDENGEIDYDIRQAITHMAIAEIGRPVCGCEEANRIFYYWQFDLSRAGGRNTEQFQVSKDDMNNPFGKQRGHIWAWQRVKEKALMRGLAF